MFALRKVLTATISVALASAGTVPAQAQVQETAIVGVTLIDGTGAPARPDVTVHFQDGKIIAVRPGDRPPGPAVLQVDARGKFLVPGFVDSNAHLTVYGKPERRDTSVKYAERNEELALEVAQRSLKMGVTTLVDSYGVLPPSIAVRDRIASGRAIGARLLVAGNILGWGGPFSLTFSLTKESDLSLFQERWNDLIAQDMGEEIMDLTPDELRTAMRGYLAKGVDVVKYGGTSHFIRPSLIGFSPEQQRAIVETAHAKNIAVQTHATSLEGLRLAVEAGLDLIQHPELMARDLPDALVRQIVKSGAYCGIRANYLTGAEWRGHISARQAAQQRIAALPPATTSAERWRRFDAIGEGEEIQRRNAERLIKAGCPVTIATDVFLGDAPEFRRTAKPDTAEPGIGSILAIEGLVELGMTPAQAIVAATRNGAAAARRLADFGTVERGKAADMVLLEADPSSDIRNIRRVAAIWAQGRLVPTERLPEAPLFSPNPRP